MPKAEQLLDFNINEAKIDKISVEDYINTYLKLYSGHSNVRGIPFIGDGFKDAQRKAMWGMLKRGDNAGFGTVERVSAYCAAETDYHHGIGSMQGTLVGLAQDFAGSNNLNLLVPEGQFGSRLSHGASAPRYIETKIHENFRLIFKKEDDLILEQKKVGDLKLEPKYFIPLLPMVLVNGAEGMGTGHSTHIFCYSPKDLRDTIVKMLDGKKVKDHTLVPAWRGFSGKVARDADTGQVIVTGKLEVESSTTIRITELPVGVQSEAFEKILEKLEDRNQAPIKSFKNASDDTGFDFIVTVPRVTTYLTQEELIRLFKLESRDTENFTMWGPDGKIKKYRSAEHVIEEFIEWRLKRYEERRARLIKNSEDLIIWLEELMRFIKFYIKNAEKFRNVGKAAIIQILNDEKFADPERLLSQQIWSLTKDRIDELQEKLDAEKKKLEEMLKDTPVEMYRRELKQMKLDF